MSARLKSVLRWSVSIALLAFVVHRLSSDWRSIEAIELHIRWGWVAAATALVGLEFMLAVEIWRMSLRWLQTPLSYPLAFHIMGVSNLAKYLPGGVWNFIGRAAMCQRYRVPAARVVESLVVEVVVQLGANAVLGALAFVAIGRSAETTLPAWTIAFAAGPVVALHPRIINSVLERASLALKRELPRVRLRYGQILFIYLVSILNWALLGLSFVLFAQGILARSLSVTEAIALLGATNAAWLAGSIAFFVPAALGVREVAFTAILGPMFGSGWPAAFAISTRVWFSVIEVAWFAIAQGISSERDTPPSGAPRGDSP